MMTVEENQQLIRVESGTPGGALMRRYWHPIALSEEASNRPVPVRLLAEDLVMFRDERGQIGLLGRECPHRRTDLVLGTVEDGGLRCCYHGWLFDVSGQCLEMPAEPPNSSFAARLRHTAFSTAEFGGIIFAYLGPEPIPPPPRYDVFVRTDGVRRYTTRVWPCNYFQALENGADPLHTGVLHRDTHPRSREMRFGIIPDLEFAETPWGMKTIALRPGPTPETVHRREVHIIMPSLFRFILTTYDGALEVAQWTVPLDDVNSRVFWCFFAPEGQPVAQRMADWEGDPSELFGYSKVIPQDLAAVAGQGAISKRYREHLATSDRGVILLRKIFSEQAAAAARDDAVTLKALSIDSKEMLTIQPVDRIEQASAVVRSRTRKAL